jgi:hypothetical protein
MLHNDVTTSRLRKMRADISILAKYAKTARNSFNPVPTGEEKALIADGLALTVERICFGKYLSYPALTRLVREEFNAIELRFGKDSLDQALTRLVEYRSSWIKAF